MICPACGHAAEASAKFCSECGRRLHSERALLARRAYTPQHLVDKILSSRSALQGERKQVTVLFADVMGSMQLAEQVDAETWHDILNRFFAILADGIHRVEGTINQYTGDGVMALFGAPIAHEDHAQRACHAALALRAELRRYADALRIEHGVNFSVRMGLNSGEVVVGSIGEDLRMDYTAQGHTVGLAARMEQLAQPGTALLTEHTARLVSGYFALRDLGPAQVKGLSESLHVFELEGRGPLRTRLDRARARGFATFVGRSSEIAAVDAAIERACHGAGTIIGIEGDAGVGKSRLCAEVVTRAREIGMNVYEAHCPSHGRNVPFLPVLALLRSYFDIQERDSAATAREKIAGRVLVHDDAARDSLPVLHDFLGVADAAQPALHMDPEARQRHLVTFVRRIVETRRGDETVLIFVDDLHWIDPASDAFVAELAGAVAATRTLLLLNYRPEYSAAWMAQPNFQHLRLSPLSESAASTLLDELVGNDPSLTVLRARIQERTGGNPFFIEEIVQALISDGSLEVYEAGFALRQPLGDLRLPDSVQSVLAARIDQLAEGDKAVLQAAAVIGKLFDAMTLQRVLGELGDEAAAALDGALQRLGDAGLIVERGERHYGFKHPLTQEVAYRSQLIARREPAHRAVANVLQQRHADNLDAVAPLLAHHWERAGATLEAARWHRRAAEWAGISNLQEATRHWQRVRELANDLAESRESIQLQLWSRLRLLDLGWRSGMPLDEASALFHEGIALTDRLGDAKGKASLLNTYGIVVGMTGDVGGGLALVEEGAQMARRIPSMGLRGVTTLALVQAQTTAGALQAAEQTLAEALAIAPADLDRSAFPGGFSPYLYLLMMRGHVRTERGRLLDAAADLERVLVLAGERRELEILGWTHEFGVYLTLALGTNTQALAHAQQALEIAERIGSPLSRASAHYSMGAVRLAAAQWPAAVAVNERGLAILRTARTGRHWESRGLALLAESLAGAGDHERARATADEAESASLSGGNRTFECVSCLALARARRLTDGAAARPAIEAALARVEALVSSTGAQLYQPSVHEERAALAQCLGDTAGARRERLTAQRLFRANGAEAHALRLTGML